MSYTQRRIRVAHNGPTDKIIDNKIVRFSDEFLLKLSTKLAGEPVVGEFNESKADFEGHKNIKEETDSYGYISENPQPTFELIEENGLKQNYLTVNANIFDRYEASELIKDKHVSIEFDPDTIKHHDEEINGVMYDIYDDAEVRGICILGMEQRPAFQSAAVFSLTDENIKQIADAVSAQKTEDTMDEKILELTTRVAELTTENASLKAELETHTATAANFESTVATKETELQTATALVTELNEKITTMQAELDTYSATIKAEEKAKKEALVSTFSATLGEDGVKDLNLDELTYETLEEKLAARAYKKGVVTPVAAAQANFTATLNIQEDTNEAIAFMRTHSN